MTVNSESSVFSTSREDMPWTSKPVIGFPSGPWTWIRNDCPGSNAKSSVTGPVSAGGLISFIMLGHLGPGFTGDIIRVEQIALLIFWSADVGITDAVPIGFEDALRSDDRASRQAHDAIRSVRFGLKRI